MAYVGQYSPNTLDYSYSNMGTQTHLTSAAKSNMAQLLSISQPGIKKFPETYNMICNSAELMVKSVNALLTSMLSLQANNSRGVNLDHIYQNVIANYSSVLNNYRQGLVQIFSPLANIQEINPADRRASLETVEQLRRPSPMNWMVDVCSQDAHAIASLIGKEGKVPRSPSKGNNNRGYSDKKSIDFGVKDTFSSPTTPDNRGKSWRRTSRQSDNSHSDERGVITINPSTDDFKTVNISPLDIMSNSGELTLKIVVDSNRSIKGRETTIERVATKPNIFQTQQQEIAGRKSPSRVINYLSRGKE